MRADGREVGPDENGPATWQAQLGPQIVAVVWPLLKYILIMLIDWYADRVTADLARQGIIERRRQARGTYRTLNGVEEKNQWHR